MTLQYRPFFAGDPYGSTCWTAIVTQYQRLQVLQELLAQEMRGECARILTGPVLTRYDKENTYQSFSPAALQAPPFVKERHRCNMTHQDAIDCLESLLMPPIHRPIRPAALGWGWQKFLLWENLSVAESSSIHQTLEDMSPQVRRAYRLSPPDLVFSLPLFRCCGGINPAPVRTWRAGCLHFPPK